MNIEAGTAVSQRLTSLTEAIFMGVNLTRAASSDVAGSQLVPVIHVKDLDNGRITPRANLETVSMPLSKIGRQGLQSGDILVSARGTLLKCALLPSSHIGCVASANFIVIRPKPSSPIAPALLCAFFRQTETRALLLSRTSGTAQPVLTIKDLETLSLVIPSREKQLELTKLIDLADEIHRTSIEIAELRRDEALDILGDYINSR